MSIDFCPSAPVTACSPSPNTTPASVRSVSRAVSVNLAVPDVISSTVRSSEPRPFLSRVITEISSVITIASPFSDFTTFWFPVVFASRLSTFSPLTSNSKLDTTVYPSGATVSSSTYVPSFRPVISELAPVNSMYFLPLLASVSTVFSTPLTVRPSRFFSSSA